MYENVDLKSGGGDSRVRLAESVRRSLADGVVVHAGSGQEGTTTSAEADARAKEREARSVAIEKAYVHDVYEQIRYGRY